MVACSSERRIGVSNTFSGYRGPAIDASIQRHVLRVSCRRCERTVEIQTVDAVRLYGGNAIWKNVARRLLDDTCKQRTGRYEEDGCWPGFEPT
jgi:hypothetical protein